MGLSLARPLRLNVSLLVKSVSRSFFVLFFLNWKSVHTVPQWGLQAHLTPNRQVQLVPPVLFSLSFLSLSTWTAAFARIEIKLLTPSVSGQCLEKPQSSQCFPGTFIVLQLHTSKLSQSGVPNNKDITLYSERLGLPAAATVMMQKWTQSWRMWSKNWS